MSRKPIYLPLSRGVPLPSHTGDIFGSSTWQLDPIGHRVRFSSEVSSASASAVEVPPETWRKCAVRVRVFSVAPGSHRNFIKSGSQPWLLQPMRVKIDGYKVCLCKVPGSQGSS